MLLSTHGGSFPAPGTQIMSFRRRRNLVIANGEQAMKSLDKLETTLLRQLDGMRVAETGTHVRYGFTTSCVTAEGTTATISMSTSSPQLRTHACNKATSSHSITWKQRLRSAVIQLAW